MSSLVERLRTRSDRRPTYNLDSSDDEADLAQGKYGEAAKNLERFVREDAKEDLCQSCGEGEGLIECQTCTYAYHPKCLVPKLKAPYPGDWKCPECVSPLSDVEKILDCEMRPTIADDNDASKLGSTQVLVKHYLVKWKGLSYLHCTWVSEKDFFNAYKSLPRLKTKVNNFHRQMESVNSSVDDFIAIRPEWTTVDRILACRGEDEEKEYFVKWKDLPYDECYWEFESDITAFQPAIERFKTIQSRRRKKSSIKEKSSARDAKESQSKHQEFQHYEQSPEFLSGGTLHPYQLEGLNFLRFSWSKQTHVILADEMGLGKTIQSIAFLGSLFEYNIGPHIVVAPLSTLRNWEREFATWAPQMNVVMYFGSSQARTVIREYEFYYPKGSTKTKKSGLLNSESKHDRIKFDVLLTSYEMINLDSVSLKPIKWECMIVDEGHRLKNKDSKLFFQLTQYSTRHRVLLTGTPLQNNLDELFMLMHFLDAGKFGSLEEFQEEFKDINHEEQISRLHTMLAPHLLRRVKKDVMKDLPPKKELILRVELSSQQKEYYRAILTRNYELLARKGGGQISLNNVVMELRKLCCHPYMLEGIEKQIPDVNDSHRELLDSSGKLQLLDKMMVKLRDQGHRVLIYSQFQNMLDILEDYLTFKKWQYERIDGKVSGAERQIRIDRFNAKNSSRFCFLLSTRAGGLGINLATADTVIIYDSDWNPHADLQAMARAHRLGQTNKVMIYRLIARATVEERMMELTKKKMILEHLVVGKLKTQNINQEELDDIIRHGSMDLFGEENEESKARQIHYDDAAIDRLLDREHIGDEDTSVDDEEEDGFLKAFKVANFEYIDEVEASAEEENQNAAIENKTTANNPDGSSYWDELLKDKYEVHKTEEFNTLGKGKRIRKQMVSVEDDDLAGLEDVSSDGEDDNYEADLSDGETTSTGAPGRKPYRKRSRVGGMERPPLMEGEGRSLRVLGFNQSQRAAFVQIVMRFGVGDFDWAEFLPRLKGKTSEEVVEYVNLFLSHIYEGVNDSPTFSDGVPKEGLRVDDVLVRLGQLSLIHDKVKLLSENPNAPLFANDTIALYPTLGDGKFWKREYDSLLLRAVLKHGYGRWQAIVDDKDLRIQQVICQELNLPFVTLPGSGAETALGSAAAANLLYQYREVQRRQVDFIKKRVLLLEKGLFAEYYKVYSAEKMGVAVNDEPENAPKREDAPNVTSVAEIMNHLPPTEMIAEETSSVLLDRSTDRRDLARLYNQMCNLIEESTPEFAQDCIENKSNAQLGRKILPQVEEIHKSVNRILSLETPPNPPADQPKNKATAEDPKDAAAEEDRMDVDHAAGSDSARPESDKKLSRPINDAPSRSDVAKKDGMEDVVVLDD